MGMTVPKKMLKIKQFFYKYWFKWFPPEMVKYWMKKESVEAKITRAPEGHYIMWMDGEKYPFPGFPRGLVLYKSLSKLKHEVKNQFFNDAWYALERGEDEKALVAERKLLGPVMDNILKLTYERRMTMVPPERMVPPVKELHRAWSVVEKTIKDPHRRQRLGFLKDCLCFILQEDDSYRFRVQWIVKFFNPSSWYFRLLGWNRTFKSFDYALQMLEQAEVVGDMKERIRLLRRILNMMLKDEAVQRLFKAFCKEVDWNKVKLSKADKYFFRAKYFKCDYPEYNEY